MVFVVRIKPVNFLIYRYKAFNENIFFVDCCDGSDEYNTDIKCQNNCYELGQAAREEEARKIAIIKEGSKIKNELSLKGKQLKREKQVILRISHLCLIYNPQLSNKTYLSIAQTFGIGKRAIRSRNIEK